MKEIGQWLAILIVIISVLVFFGVSLANEWLPRDFTTTIVIGSIIVLVVGGGIALSLRR
jgi:protein-S-isoprenylcysteine O-methyltransferase Ste14